MNIERAIEKTESFLIEQRETIPNEVYNFIKQICQEERKAIEMVKNWSQEKKVFKV